MTTQSSYTVVLTDSTGVKSEFITVAETPCKAFLAARELYPELEILKVEREGEWG